MADKTPEQKTPEQKESSFLNKAAAVAGWGFRAFIWDTNDSLGANLLKVGLTGASLIAAPFSGGWSLAARSLLTAGFAAARVPVVGNALWKAGLLAEKAAPTITAALKPLFTASKGTVLNPTTGKAVELGRKISVTRSAATVGAATIATENAGNALEAAGQAGGWLWQKTKANAADVDRTTDGALSEAVKTLKEAATGAAGEARNAVDGALNGGAAPGTTPPGTAGGDGGTPATEAPDDEAAMLNQTMEGLGINLKDMGKNMKGSQFVKDNWLAVGLGALAGMNTDGNLAKKGMKAMIVTAILAPILHVMKPFLQPFMDWIKNAFSGFYGQYSGKSGASVSGGVMPDTQQQQSAPGPTPGTTLQDSGIKRNVALKEGFDVKAEQAPTPTKAPEPAVPATLTPDAEQRRRARETLSAQNMQSSPMGSNTPALTSVPSLGG